MGRIILKSALMSKTQNLIDSATDRQQNVYEVMTALNDFASDSVLTGEAYKNAKGFISRVYIPICKALCMALEDEITANRKVLSSCTTYLKGTDRFDENAINGEVERLKSEYRKLSDPGNLILGMILPAAAAINADRIAFCLWRIKRLEHYLEELDRFDKATKNLHNSAAAQMDTICKKIDSIFSPALFSNGKFDYSRIDMSWAAELVKKWDASARNSELETEFKFKQNLMDQFGFDAETVEIMYQVYDSLKEKYPNASQLELDWRIARLIGGLVYDDDKFKWNDVAGIAIDQYETRYLPGSGDTVKALMSEEEYFTFFLGIEKKDYLLLRYKVRVQHEITRDESGFALPKSLEELKNGNKFTRFKDWNKTFNEVTGNNYHEEKFFAFWKNQYKGFRGKGDFAHQQITMSSILAERLGEDGVLSNWGALAEGKLDYWSNAKVVEKAGWLGDATIKAKETGKTSLGADDYIADLDAANIATYMKKGNSSYFNAANRYYDDLQAGTSRAALFLQETPLNEIKCKIRKEIVDPEILAQLQLAGDRHDVEEIRRLSGLLQDETYAMDKIKKEQPDTYRFIKSLESEANVMEASR